MRTPECGCGVFRLVGFLRPEIRRAGLACLLMAALQQAAAQEFYIDDFYEDGVTLWRRDTWFQDDHGRNIHLKTTWYHRNGQKLEEGGYLDGLREGAWQTWFESGQMSSERHYTTGALQGAFTAWYDNGNVATQGLYAANLQTGEWSAYHDNAVLAERGSYSYGQRTGLWTFWAESGGKTLEGFYAAGLEDGAWQAWYRTGIPYEEGFKWMDLVYAGGVLTAKTVYWYNEYEPQPPGTLWRKEEISFAGADELNRTTYYLWGGGPPDDLILWQEENYKNGVRHGWFRVYWFSDVQGPVATETRYVNGFIADHYEWYTNGNKAEESHGNAAGLLHGFYGKWKEDGSPEVLGHYVDGYGQGFWEYWTESWWWIGSLLIDHTKSYRGGIMHMGVEVGLWHYWSDVTHINYDGIGYQQYFMSQYLDTGGQPPSPPLYATPEAEVRQVRGKVTDWSTGDPLSGATIACADQTTMTDSQGFYLLTLAGGSYDQPVTLTTSLDGYVTSQRSLDLHYLLCATENVPLKARTNPVQPTITAVSSELGTFFVAGVTVLNTYTVAVDWNGAQPGSLLVNVNGVENPWPATPQGGTFTLDMGQDLIPSTDLNRNFIIVKARNSNGVESPIHRLRPVCAPSPGWLSPLSWAFTFAASASDGAPTYSLASAWPEPPVKLLLRDYMPTSLWEKWKDFPYLGGDFGLEQTQVSIAAEYKTDNTGSIAVGGQGGFTVANKVLLAKIKGAAKLENKRGLGLEWQASEVNLGVEGRVEQELGVAQLCPPLAAAYQFPIVGRMLKMWSTPAKVKAGFGVFGGSNFELGTTNVFPYILSKCSPEFGCNGTLAASADIFNGLEAEASVNGAVKVVGQIFPEQQLEKVEAELSAKIAAVIRCKKREFEKKHTFTYPFAGDPNASAATLSFSGELLKPATFTSIGRDFLGKAGYSRFVAPHKGAQAVGAASLAPPPRTAGPMNAECQVLYNAFPYAQPAIATRPDGCTAIAYVTFDPYDVTEQATEIAVIVFDGTYYSYPLQVCNDTRAEFSPAAAFDSIGRLVAVWERVKDEAFTGAGLEELMPQMEIVTATLDLNTYAWTTPVPLTDNDYADFSPLLRRSPDGGLFLTWQSNVSNELAGSVGSPSILHSARWNASLGEFEAVTNAAAELADVVGLDVAFDGSEALAVYARDLDGDFETVGDVELFQMRESGGVWSAPSQLTDNGLPDLNPRVACRATGALELAWLQGTNMVRLADWNTGAAESIRTAGGGFTLADFRLACDGLGRLVVIWQNHDREGPDLFYSVFDPIHHVWSEDLRLTRDDLLEKSATGALAEDGTLNLAYMKKDMSNDVTHLYHLSYHLRTDLAAEALTLAPQSPTTNEATAVTCRVRNAGDLTVSGAQVSFYLGDPSVGGVLIGAAAVSPNVLRAGAEGTASLSWTTPADAQPAELVAIVDADGAVVEEDEANNATSMWLFLPDLRVDSVRYEERASGEVDLIARVFNAGTLAAPPFQVGFSADGYDIGSEEMPGLLPGTAYDVARLAWAQVTFTNRPARVVAAVDPLDAIAEGNESNNTDYVEVLLESDCDGDQMADQWEKCFFFDLSRDETSDSDGDGASDQHECWAGTDPTDSGSVFRCAIGPHDEQGRIQLAWQVVPGQTYQLQRCDDLRLGEWQDVGEPVTVDSGVLQQSFLDEPPAGVRQRYYRVRLVTAP